MKSKWSLTCEKVAAGIVTKKFERLMAVKMEDVETQRVLYQGRKLEMLYFFIDFPQVHDWDALILAQLALCERFSHRWHVALTGKRISAEWTFGSIGTMAGIGGDATIAGAVDASWEIAEDQVYSQMTWLGDKPDMW